MIVCVVPTIRNVDKFIEAWWELFDDHDVRLLVVYDGEEPHMRYGADKYTLKEVLGDNSDLVHNFNDGCRNLGFAFIAKHLPHAEYIITLDDDVLPNGDTIGDHIDILKTKVPISWMSTMVGEYPRGFPYNKRDEAPVMLSHGYWWGVHDWDAPTQLVMGTERQIEPYVGVIPKGVKFPMCGMNVAFRRELLPYMYWAPMGNGIDRFADIWLGIEVKEVLDANNWAAVTGFSSVNHNRASNVWKNLQKEAKGLEMNENYGEGEYFKMYKEKRERWKDLILQLV